MYEVYSPTSSTDFRFLIDGFESASYYDIIVVDAKPYVGEGAEFMEGY